MLKLLLFVFTFTILCLTGAQAQGWSPAGARSMSLANASVALGDVWSYHHNPGALATLKKTSFGVSYEDRFSLKELQSQALVVAHPLKKGVVSLGAQFYGYSAYRTTRVGLGYSLQLSEKIFAGVQLNYQGLKIAGYGQKGTVSGEAGILAKINDQVSFGFSVLNLNQAKLVPAQNDRFSTYLRLGLAYNVSSKVILLAEAEKEVTSKLRPKGAMEYKFSDKFFLRIGVAANPVELTFGTGLVFNKVLKMDLGTGWDQRLGWSPHLGFTFDLNGANDE
ncbi:MAG: hypothetical protein K0R65_1581 [Crocinitomicaceae bacterium]|jgi:hypothetical protein|nr:hypothetical protein [Crocinitomicaceae bacterium]